MVSGDARGTKDSARDEKEGRGDGQGGRCREPVEEEAQADGGDEAWREGCGTCGEEREELVEFQSAVDVARTNERLIGEQEERHMRGVGSFRARRVFENGDSFPMNLSEMTFKEMETQDWNS